MMEVLAGWVTCVAKSHTTGGPHRVTRWSRTGHSSLRGSHRDPCIPKDPGSAREGLRPYGTLHSQVQSTPPHTTD
ncbi:hypothetical protein E2C01_082335 [Portunus trituberculatus]|uniref:Uncharacterized protein n=1 Tax=Portunus trituberculatus TaxID=210409 RepID=A0A5B7IYY4_PORTR|nr:hypothetical protein [Portunus trituberculatus]